MQKSFHARKISWQKHDNDFKFLISKHNDPGISQCYPKVFYKFVIFPAQHVPIHFKNQL